MRILHTSDWHLGRTLYDKRRHEEHAAFLDWLHQVMVDHQVEVLLVCGDIFDTIAPSNRSLQLYYQFLRKAVDSGCRHIIIVGGNHDAPSLLDAPRQVLETIGVHVVGGATREIEDELFVLHDKGGEPRLIVCAIPFLRDRDVREVVAEESADDKGSRLVSGIASHYRQAGEAALLLRERLQQDIPIICTGHLFTAGGKTAEGDGVRDLYVGTAAHVGPKVFPACADYVALGHLHVPQRVGGSDTVRYSGSPLPMGFSEAGQRKEVVLVDLVPHALFPIVQPLEVPCFQHLLRISGDLDAILLRLREIALESQSVWVEIDYRGDLAPAVLRQMVQEATEGTQVEILRLRNSLVSELAMHQTSWQEGLEDIDEHEVFKRALDANDVPESDRLPLTELYDTVLQSFQQEDPS